MERLDTRQVGASLKIILHDLCDAIRHMLAIVLVWLTGPASDANGSPLTQYNIAGNPTVAHWSVAWKDSIGRMIFLLHADHGTHSDKSKPRRAKHCLWNEQRAETEECNRSTERV